MSVRMKMVCTGKQPSEGQQWQGKIVTGYLCTFMAVWEGFKENDVAQGPECEENRIFGDATPNGHISLFIVNPEASEQYEAGKAYYFDSTPAPDPKKYSPTLARYAVDGEAVGVSDPAQS